MKGRTDVRTYVRTYVVRADVDDVMAIKPNFLTSMGYHIFLTMVLRARARSSAIKILFYSIPLGEVSFCLMAVSAQVASYTVSLFRDITAKAANSAEKNRTATRPGTTSPTLIE